METGKFPKHGTVKKISHFELRYTQHVLSCNFHFNRESGSKNLLGMLGEKATHTHHYFSKTVNYSHRAAGSDQLGPSRPFAEQPTGLAEANGTTHHHQSVPKDACRDSLLRWDHGSYATLKAVPASPHPKSWIHWVHQCTQGGLTVPASTSFITNHL